MLLQVFNKIDIKSLNVEQSHGLGVSFSARFKKT